MKILRGNQIVSHVTFEPVKKTKGIELTVKGGREGYFHKEMS